MAKVFNDPIHGHMALDPLLVKIIDTPEFQRLRNIKQLGGIYFVYPGASHNRFEHSIGVAHLAGELAKALKMKQKEQIEEIKKSKELDKTKLEELEKSLISEQDVLCVQIAGLCHDLGHGPFSHFYDGIFMKAIQDKKAKDSTAATKDGTAATKDTNDWKHETASVKMFIHLLEENGLKEEMKKRGLNLSEFSEDENDLTFIKELIDADQAECKGRKKEKSFLYEIVSNKKTGIDVDKFDYFARDCQHLGIPNSFDHQRFIMFARVCDVEENGSKTKHICSRDKELANLYDLFQTRLSIHRRACQHKIKMAVEIMIKDAFLLVDDHPDFKIKGSKEDEKFSLSEAKGDMKAYIKLTDHVIEKILYSESSSSKEADSSKEDESASLEEADSSKEDESKKAEREKAANDNAARQKARKILKRVMKRNLYQCVGQATLNKEDKAIITEEMKEKLRGKLVENSKVTKEMFEVIDVTFNYGMEDANPINKVFFYRKDDLEKGIPISELQLSRLFPVNFSEKILRVYWKEQKTEPDIIQDVQHRFQSWCQENGFEVEKRNMMVGSDTQATPGNEQST